MKGMIALLSPREENTLRLIGFRGEFDRAHVVRLTQLDLIKWDGSSWRLTELGRQRCDKLLP